MLGPTSTLFGTVTPVPAAGFTYHYYPGMACKIQVDILSCTDNPIEITNDAMEALHALILLERPQPD